MDKEDGPDFIDYLKMLGSSRWYINDQGFQAWMIFHSPEHSLIEVELTIEKLKRHKATGVDHIPSELIQAVGGKLYEEIHKLIILIFS